jgi:hypothetical protein
MTLRRSEARKEEARELGAELTLEPLAHDRTSLLDVGGQARDDLAVPDEPVERSIEACGVERLGVHVLDIGHEPSDDIPRTKGLRPRVAPPIEQVMLPAQKPAWLPLGALLVREGLISNEQLETALIDQQGTGLRVGELLVQWGWVDSGAISRALAEQYELEFVDLDTVEIDPKAVELLAARDARHYDAIPIRFLEGDHLLVGVADPTDVGTCDELCTKLGGAVTLVVVDQTELHRALAREYA